MLKFGFTESEYKVFLYDHDDFNILGSRFQTLAWLGRRSDLFAISLNGCPLELGPSH